jgi:hypothetical protein
MKESTRQKLIDARKYCDRHDKSTEFMIQYMMDTAGVDMDCVMNFLQKTSNPKLNRI